MIYCASPALQIPNRWSSQKCTWQQKNLTQCASATRSVKPLIGSMHVVCHSWPCQVGFDDNCVVLVVVGHILLYMS